MNQVATVANDASPPAPMVLFRQQLDSVAAEMHAGSVPVEKIKSAIVIAVQKNPELLKANRVSFWRSARMCAADGLLPDGREAALVTFNTKVKTDRGEEWQDHVQYLPMVYGVIKRVRNSGSVESLWAEVVHQSDKFTIIIDDNTGERRIKHDFSPFAPIAERGPMVGTYAVAKLKGGSLEVETMSAEEVDGARRASRGQKEAASGPWAGPFRGQMWEKTVIKRLAKRLPASGDPVAWHDDNDGEVIEYDARPRTASPRKGGVIYRDADAMPPPDEIHEGHVVEDALTQDQSDPGYSRQERDITDPPST